MFGLGLRMPALLIIIGFILWVIAVISLSKKEIDNISKVLWAAFFTWTPIVGPICYFVINPKKEIS